VLVENLRDNGSAVAAVLELARLFRDARPARTARCVAFVNEEPPFYRSEQMGSRVSLTCST
jgi:Zn-dependent M28 family amino/carboxypeptidase